MKIKEGKNVLPLSYYFPGQPAPPLIIVILLFSCFVLLLHHKNTTCFSFLFTTIFTVSGLRTLKPWHSLVTQQIRTSKAYADFSKISYLWADNKYLLILLIITECVGSMFLPCIYLYFLFYFLFFVRNFLYLHFKCYPLA